MLLFHLLLLLWRLLLLLLPLLLQLLLLLCTRARRRRRRFSLCLRLFARSLFLRFASALRLLLLQPRAFLLLLTAPLLLFLASPPCLLFRFAPGCPTECTCASPCTQCAHFGAREQTSQAPQGMINRTESALAPPSCVFLPLRGADAPALSAVPAPGDACKCADRQYSTHKYGLRLAAKRGSSSTVLRPRAPVPSLPQAYRARRENTRECAATMRAMLRRGNASAQYRACSAASCFFRSSSSRRKRSALHKRTGCVDHWTNAHAHTRAAHAPLGGFTCLRHCSFIAVHARANRDSVFGQCIHLNQQPRDTGEVRAQTAHALQLPCVRAPPARDDAALPARCTP